MTQTYTPGPWTFKGRYQDEPIVATDKPVVSLGDDGACGDPDCCGGASYHVEMSEPDGRLISQAPALLEALEEIDRWAQSNNGEYDTALQALMTIGDIARIAIQRARGEV